MGLRSLKAVVVILTVIFLTRLSFAGERVMYALSPTNVFIGGIHGKTAGVLEMGARVYVIRNQGGWFKISVNGWQIKGLPSVVYAFKGIRVVKMQLTPAGEKSLRVLKKVKDSTTGLVWKEVKLEGVWVRGNDLTANKGKVWKRASSLFHERCSMCHALPKSTEFTANQWPATLRVMTKRAALSKKEADEVSLFLQYHARDTISR